MSSNTMLQICILEISLTAEGDSYFEFCVNNDLRKIPTPHKTQTFLPNFLVMEFL